MAKRRMKLTNGNPYLSVMSFRDLLNSILQTAVKLLYWMEKSEFTCIYLFLVSLTDILCSTYIIDLCMCQICVKF